MADTAQAVLIAAVAGVVSAVLTYFSTRAKIRLDLVAEYDKKLQEARLNAYLQVWKVLEPLARFGREQPVTRAILTKVSNDTRTWYFQVGGIYLTRQSRDPYFSWKKQLQQLVENPKYANAPDIPIDEAELKPVLEAASALRTSLSDDIGTRKLSLL